MSDDAQPADDNAVSLETPDDAANDAETGVMNDAETDPANDELGTTHDAAEPGVAPPSDDLDLDRIDADLAGVERALSRLDDGSYWNDEVTGDPIDPSVLDADPTATRA